MKQKIQKFGGAMFTPVLLFAFAGIMVGLATTCMNPQIMGDLAVPVRIRYSISCLSCSQFLCRLRLRKSRMPEHAWKPL